MRKGFTLIELLVVISIISLLSSVVLSSLNAARDKAKAGGGKEFAASAYHAAGDQAIGIWDFDENGGTSASDRSGSAYTGTLTNGPTWTSDTPNTYGSSVLFDGVDDYVTIPYNSNQDTSVVTVMAWAKTALTGWRKVVGRGPDASEVYGLYVSPTGTFQVERQINGLQVALGSSMKINDGKWHHLAYVYDGAVESMYVDGALVSSRAIAGALTSTTENIVIGAEKSSSSSVYYWNGPIDDVRIFAKGLTAMEVRRIFALEEAHHNIAVK